MDLRRIAHSLALMSALTLAVALAGCDASSSPSVPPSPSSPPSSSLTIELRPVLAVSSPDQPDYEALAGRLGQDVFYGDEDGNHEFDPGVEVLYVLDAAFVAAGDFASATVSGPVDAGEQWSVNFELTPDASDRLANATAEAADRSGAIAVVEGERVLVAPTINTPITSGLGQVPAATRRDAEEIAGLMLGSMSSPS
jgi:preprotein translocase subunit SecD